MFDVHPDEIRLRGCDQLGHEGTWDALRDTHETLTRISLSVFERLPEICRLGEHSGAIRCFGVELGLLAVGLEVCHLEQCSEPSGGGRWWKCSTRKNNTIV